MNKNHLKSSSENFKVVKISTFYVDEIIDNKEEESPALTPIKQNKRSIRDKENLLKTILDKIKQSKNLDATVIRKSNPRIRRPSMPFRIGGRLGKVFYFIYFFKRKCLSSIPL